VSVKPEIVGIVVESPQGQMALVKDLERTSTQITPQEVSIPVDSLAKLLRRHLDPFVH
jgi:hypothetical protein